MFNPFSEIGFTDVIDIGFVSVLLYAVIVWLKRTRANFVLIGIFILGTIYVLARQFGLQLTAWIFQGFFAILLIIIVVIFQAELRQIFERIALWSLRPSAPPSLRSEKLDVLVRTLADFAKEGIGALIVIRGKDLLERHIVGGIELEGKLSEPLLKSIFDPHSPGHDGAVIIEGERVSRFAVYLPLSKDVQQLSQVGTRHSAALGLAKLTDALCIVVSEERGKISVARDGKLQRLGSVQELGALFKRFLEERYLSQHRRRVSIQLWRENWLEKALSLCLAIGLWIIFLAGTKTAEITYLVPIAVENLPSGMILDGVQPSEVNVTFAGPLRAFYLFDRTNLRVTIDASLAALGRRTFRISEQNVHFPKAFSLDEISPPAVKLSVRKLPLGDKAARG
jgi:diadenylate cyclase